MDAFTVEVEELRVRRAAIERLDQFDLVIGDGAVEVFHDDADVKERRKADGHGYPLDSMN
ncbi:hypothetical protein [Streptomyces lanatus]|uniref:Uncharacterized protein n=1 Tax=Streptomyces lanatus TaxID=66900 RepID=A0ABV1XUQ7_9ACTN|nr:hypothetical protein [Streptomyces lanatus]